MRDYSTQEPLFHPGPRLFRFSACLLGSSLGGLPLLHLDWLAPPAAPGCPRDELRTWQARAAEALRAWRKWAALTWAAGACKGAGRQVRAGLLDGQAASRGRVRGVHPFLPQLEPASPPPAPGTGNEWGRPPALHVAGCNPFAFDLCIAKPENC